MTKFYLIFVQMLYKAIYKNSLIQYAVPITIFTITITLFTLNLKAQDIHYPPTVEPYKLVEVSATPEGGDYDLNWLIMDPVDLESKRYENNKYLVFASPAAGQVLILVQYVDYEKRKSNLEKILIKVAGPPPPDPDPDPTPPPPDPDPDPDPNDLTQLVEHWLINVPSEYRSPNNVKDVGQNYIVAAGDVPASSTAPRDEMVGRVKVLNIQTLGPSATRQWAEPFFLPLAKWMDAEGIPANNYEKQKALFEEVGTSIKAAKYPKEGAPVDVPFRSHPPT